MTYTAPNVNVDSPGVVLWVPALNLTSNGIHWKPRNFRRTTESHVVIEVGKLRRVVTEPCKRMKIGLPGILEGSM